MAIYFGVSLAAIFIGVMLIISGIIFRKKLSSAVFISLLFVGIFITLMFGVLASCFGFFMFGTKKSHGAFYILYTSMEFLL